MTSKTTKITRVNNNKKTKISCSRRPFDCFFYKHENLCGLAETNCTYSSYLKTKTQITKTMEGKINELIYTNIHFMFGKEMADIFSVTYRLNNFTEYNQIAINKILSVVTSYKDCFNNNEELLKYEQNLKESFK